MRRRKFEILCDVGIGFHTREPLVSYRVIDKRDWFDRLFAQRRPALFIGDSPGY